jgi:hypothetical protein
MVSHGRLFADDLVRKFLPHLRGADRASTERALELELEKFQRSDRTRFKDEFDID